MSKLLGTVSSEGGPLLIADATFIQSWRGIDDGGADYDRACELSGNGGEITLGAGHGVLWEMGPGTATVVRQSESTLVLSCGWFETADPDDESFVSLASLPLSDLSVALGEVTVHSGTLVILWAPENGRCVESTVVPSDGIPTGEMSMGGTGLIVAVRPGRYAFLHDEVETDHAGAQRCHVRRLDGST